MLAFHWSLLLCLLHPPKSPVVHFFLPPSVLSALEHLILLPPHLFFLSFTLTHITVSLCQLCISSVLFCTWLVIIFVSHSNLEAHHLLKPNQSICLTLPTTSVASRTHSPVLSPLHPCLILILLLLRCVAMLESMSRRSRSLLSLTLTTLALALSILALCTSYWCEGTHKVVKPLCLSPVKMKNCGQNNSEPYTTGTQMH